MSSVASGCLGHFFLSVPDLPMTIALARRYRPRRFADLLVQDHVAAALRGAVARNRVGHGYLLTGPRGVGKTPPPGSWPWHSIARTAHRRWRTVR